MLPSRISDTSKAGTIRSPRPCACLASAEPPCLIPSHTCDSYIFPLRFSFPEVLGWSPAPAYRGHLRHPDTGPSCVNASECPPSLTFADPQPHSEEHARMRREYVRVWVEKVGL